MSHLETGKRICSLCLDFNWDMLGRPASPGLYAQADPVAHLDWFLESGANVIQTFCVSYNGYAWYKGSDIAPVTPGLRYDYLPVLTQKAHQEGLGVMGYFCLGANPYWSQEHPQHSYWHAFPNTINMPLHDGYLDYFCGSVADALLKTEIDGFMVDWVNRPTRSDQWVKVEADLFRTLMGEPPPDNGKVPEDVMLEYDRRSIARAWLRLRETVERIRPSALIWTNHPLLAKDKDLWNDTAILREADWILNESQDLSLLSWLQTQCGHATRIIQCLVGWDSHDADAAMQSLTDNQDLYGFCKVAPDTGLPSPEVSQVDCQNVNALAAYYRRLSHNRRP